MSKYTIDYEVKMYGSIVIEAESKEEAADIFWNGCEQRVSISYFFEIVISSAGFIYHRHRCPLFLVEFGFGLK